MLSGGPPFGGDHLWDVYQAHFSMDAAPLNLGRPAVPVEVATLVAKMMAKEPGKRFQNPGEVAHALVPFFRSGNAAAGPKTQVSETNGKISDKGIAGSVSIPTRPRTNVVPPLATTTGNHEGGGQPGSMWESLIDLRDTEKSIDVVPASAVGRRTPWPSWPLVAAAFLFVFVALVVIITIRTKKGETTLSAPDDKPFTADVDNVHIEVKPSKDDGKGSPSVRSGEGLSQEADVVAARSKSDHAEESHQDRFVPLFNNVDMNGWVEGPISNGEWSVVDGVLEGRGSGERRGPAVLVTQKKNFTNFRLRAKFRYPEGGGGSIEIRCNYDAIRGSRSSYPVATGVWPSGHEYALPPGKINKLTGVRYGAGFAWHHPSEPVTVTPNTWNTLEIEAVENRITTSINEKKTAEFTDQDAWFGSGAIALQCLYHSRVQFQYVTMQELSR